jgi:hypothetical protein
MKTINEVRDRQLSILRETCIKNKIDFASLEILLDSERIKKLQKRNHYMQQTIDNEIDKFSSK